MEDDEKKPEEDEKDPKPAEDKGSIDPTTPLLDKGLSIVERMEAANKDRKEIISQEEEVLNRQERLMAQRVLGGTGDAGGDVVKEETPQEYAKRVMAGDV